MLCNTQAQEGDNRSQSQDPGSAKMGQHKPGTVALISTLATDSHLGRCI